MFGKDKIVDLASSDSESELSEEMLEENEIKTELSDGEEPLETEFLSLDDPLSSANKKAIKRPSNTAFNEPKSKVIKISAEVAETVTVTLTKIPKIKRETALQWKWTKSKTMKEFLEADAELGLDQNKVIKLQKTIEEKFGVKSMELAHFVEDEVLVNLNVGKKQEKGSILSTNLLEKVIQPLLAKNKLSKNTIIEKFKKELDCVKSKVNKTSSSGYPKKNVILPDTVEEEEEEDLPKKKNDKFREQGENVEDKNVEMINEPPNAELDNELLWQLILSNRKVIKSNAELVRSNQELNETVKSQNALLVELKQTLAGEKPPILIQKYNAVQIDCLPIRSLEEVAQFECNLINPDFQNTFIAYISSFVDNASPVRCIARMVTSVFSKNFIPSMRVTCMIPLVNPVKFSQTLFFKLMCDTLANTYKDPNMKKVIMDKFSEYFRREAHRIKKLLENEPSHENDIDIEVDSKSWNV